MSSAFFTLGHCGCTENLVGMNDYCDFRLPIAKSDKGKSAIRQLTNGNDKRMNLYKYASPATFYPTRWENDSVVRDSLGDPVSRWVFTSGSLLRQLTSQQGDAYRIIFIHVPAAWMGMLLYVLMAIYARHRLGF